MIIKLFITAETNFTNYASKFIFYCTTYRKQIHNLSKICNEMSPIVDYSTLKNNNYIIKWICISEYLQCCMKIVRE